MENESAFKDLAGFIVKSLVDNPDQVSISLIDEGSSMTLEVSVDEGDMGRVIGKRGVVVNNIRNLLRVLEAKTGKRVSVEIV